MPVCSYRFDDSLTTIRTGANNGSTSTIGVGTYIVLGIQQWGRNGASFRGTIVYNFPIAFTTEMMWVSNSHNTSSTNDSPWACGGWGGTLTSVSVYSNGTDVSYIAIGR